PPQTGEPHRSPWPPPTPPPPPDSAAPSASTPPTWNGLLRTCRREQPTAKKEAPAEWWTLTPSKLSPRYRGQCRPGTGVASPNCQAGTGATVSSMNRVRTPRIAQLCWQKCWQSFQHPPD